MLRVSINKVALLVGVSFLPFAAYASSATVDSGAAANASQIENLTGDYNNMISVGGSWQSKESAKYGRYNASPDDGLHATGGVNLNSKSAWDSGETKYFQVTGDNLNFNGDYFMPNASATVKYGDQGKWGVKAFFDNTSYNQSNNFHSLLTTSGSSIVGLGGITTGAISQGTGNGQATAADIALTNKVNAALLIPAATQTIGLQRDKVGGEVLYNIKSDWDFTAGVQHEHKEGTKENSMVVGKTSVNATNTAVFYFPEPVNYDTDRYDAKLNYKGKNAQAILSYSFSDFKDNNKAYNAQDPFNTTGLATGYAGSVYSLPPDNQAHQIKGQFAYNITPTTRFNSTLSYGLMTQNDAFVAQGLNNFAYPALPASSFDGSIQTLFGNAQIIAHPIDKLDVKTSYTIDNRQNHSPRLNWNTYQTDTTSAFAITQNTPYSFTYQTANAEATYHILSATRLTVGDTYQIKQRDYSASDRNTENTVNAQVNSKLLDKVYGMIGVSNGIRTAKSYNGSTAWAALGDVGVATSTAGDYDVLKPGLVHYSEAARNRKELKGNLSWSPRDSFTAGLTSKFYEDHYPDSPYGITNDHTLEISPDFTYTPTKNITTHLFYSYEQIYYGLNDIVNGSGCSKTPVLNACPAGGVSTVVPVTWQLGTKNQVHTAGADGDWKATDKLKFGLSYVFQMGGTAFNQNDQVNPLLNLSAFNYTPLAQLPTDKTTLHSVTVHGEYELAKNMSLWAGYTFEHFHDNNYLNAQTSSDPTAANFVLPGEGSPNYNVHVIGTALRFKW